MSKLPQYLVIDLETSIKNKGEDAVGTMPASPFYPDNNIVMAGTMARDDIVATITTQPTVGHDALVPTPPAKEILLVGQNIKFDLLYLMRDKKWRHWLKTGMIWDTMVVEYLLTGQTQKYVSLDKLSEKYGGTQKTDIIKQYWDAGIDTEDIDKFELADYLNHDVLNTDIVFKGQYSRAQGLGMLPLINSQMDALLATTEMEFNGIHFDVEKALELSIEVEDELNKKKSILVSTMEASGMQNPNPNSQEHISLYLFGGKQTIQEKWRLVEGVAVSPTMQSLLDDKDFDVYGPTAKKAGQFKTRIVNLDFDIKGEFDNPSIWSKPAKKTGIYSTAEDVLKQIREKGPSSASYFCGTLLEYRGLEKDLNTYYIGYGNLYWPTDHCIHGSFNHTATQTGRLSSSKPNLQNLSNKS